MKKFLKGEKEINIEILEQILTKESLSTAYKKVKANKGAPGVDGVSINDVYQQIVDNKSTDELDKVCNR